MSDQDRDMQDKIIQEAMEEAAFDGWSWKTIETAADNVGYSKEAALQMFPQRLPQAMAYFSDYADRLMMTELEKQDVSDLGTTAKIKLGVQTRLNVLEGHKEAVRAASVYWLVPTHKVQAGKLVWKTADHIWNWAGDTATDYNHYTKRALLGSVLSSIFVYWLNDVSQDHQESWAFLDRRIANVLKVGGVAGKVFGPILKHCTILNKKRA